jgi:hypothetical protein
MSLELYTESEESGSESEGATDDDDESYEDDEHGDATQESDAGADEDFENASSGTCNENGGSRDNDPPCDNKACLCTFLHKHLPIH